MYCACWIKRLLTALQSISYPAMLLHYFKRTTNVSSVAIKRNYLSRESKSLLKRVHLRAVTYKMYTTFLLGISSSSVLQTVRLVTLWIASSLTRWKLLNTSKENAITHYPLLFPIRNIIINSGLFFITLMCVDLIVSIYY